MGSLVQSSAVDGAPGVYFAGADAEATYYPQLTGRAAMAAWLKPNSLRDSRGGSLLEQRDLRGGFARRNGLQISVDVGDLSVGEYLG